MKKAAICIVQNRAAAESVVSQLRSRGFSNDDISVLFPDKDGTKDFAHVENTKAPEGAIAGVGAGGLIGGTVGLLAGIGALAIPGAGPFIAAGPLLGALSGAASGATCSSISAADWSAATATGSAGPLSPAGRSVSLSVTGCGSPARVSATRTFAA